MRVLARKLLGSGGTSGGGSSLVAFLNGGDVQSIGLAPRTATVRIASDGIVYHGDNGYFDAQGWWRLAGLSSDFEIRCTVVSGSVSGTTGSWLALSTTRDWSIIDSSDNGEDVFAEITLEIRLAAPPNTVLTSANWTMTAFRV